MSVTFSNAKSPDDAGEADIAIMIANVSILLRTFVAL